MANCRLSQAVPICWGAEAAQTTVPLVLVVDDSITVRPSPSVCCSAKATASALAADGLQKPWSVCRTSADPGAVGHQKCRAWTASICCAISAPIRRSRHAGGHDHFAHCQKHREMARDLGAQSLPWAKPYSMRNCWV